jgi:DNA-binding transcriptional ArsR family regulator
MSPSYTTFESRIGNREAQFRQSPAGRYIRPVPFGFLTNHGLVLLCIAHDPNVRMRDIAENVQITERATQRIVAELIEAGYVESERVGRRNRYTVKSSLPISLPARRDLDLDELLHVLLPDGANSGHRHAKPSSAGQDGSQLPAETTEDL